LVFPATAPSLGTQAPYNGVTPRATPPPSLGSTRASMTPNSARVRATATTPPRWAVPSQLVESSAQTAPGLSPLATTPSPSTPRSIGLSAAQATGSSAATAA